MQSPMSAFPESGHKDWSIGAVSNVRFRPEADMSLRDLEINYLVIDDSILASILSIAEITLSNSPAA